MAAAISVENLSKSYRLGQIGTGTLANDLKVWWARLRGKPNPLLKIGEQDHGNRQGETIWALKDVNFQVEQGEVLGIIGRNGAGKSTLLKILSRVTAPTRGLVKVKGRIASLLEVGTGFHPELTGRENIYLNGTIMGMSKEEVRRKFDEIVAFSEVEQFIDTPVKRYSSGMYVRLAFAVAAHLEPEILLVDEVLAVGDAEFQKKCLGKMGDVAKEGRTVLFVSHNMQAVSSLCSRGILLSNGRLELHADVRKVIRNYLLEKANSGAQTFWSPSDSPGDQNFRLLGVRLVNNHGEVTTNFQSGEPVKIQFECEINKLDSALVIGFDLITPEGITVMRCLHNDSSEKMWPSLITGRNYLECELPPGLLNAGTYGIYPRISLHCIKYIVYLDAVLTFNLHLSHGVSPFWNVLTKENRPGVISPIIPWRTCIP